MRLFIIHNPAAGRVGRRLYRSVLSRLEDAGCTLSVCDTDGPGHATQLAEKTRGYDRIVVVGGDGTINEVINGLEDLPATPPFAIVPVGTSNVLAAEIGLSRRAADIVDVILNGNAVRIVLGRVNGRLFSVMTGVGIDAHLVANVDRSLKRRLGPMAFALSFLKQLRTFNFSDYWLSIDSEFHIVGSVIISNASRYSPSWVIAPKADLLKVELQVCRVANPGNWKGIFSAIALFGGRLSEGHGLTIDTCQQVTIDGPPGEPVQADGDIVTSLPAEVTVNRSSLRLIYPP